MQQQLRSPGALVPVHDHLSLDARLNRGDSSPQADSERRSHTFVMPVVSETPLPSLDPAKESGW